MRGCTNRHSNQNIVNNTIIHKSETTYTYTINVLFLFSVFLVGVTEELNYQMFSDVSLTLEWIACVALSAPKRLNLLH